MTQTPLTKEALRTSYEIVRPDYERLDQNLKRDLQALLDEAGIHVLEVQSRVKDFESLWDKAQAKRYSDPLEETEDICGLRVVAYYSSDLDDIVKMINKEFDVREELDKSNELGPTEFGYRSIHVIVMVKEDWLKAPCYRGLDGLKAEVQVRTVLMHAWASISHDLWYKVTGVPEQFQHDLSRLAAMLERVDDDFDALRDKRAQYVGALSEEAESGELRGDQELNIDSLTALLDSRFTDRVANAELTSHLLGVLNSLEMSMGELLKALDRVKDILPQVEAELVKGLGGWYGTQPAAVLIALALVNDRYWHESVPFMNPGEVRLIGRWRAKLPDSTAE